MKYRVTLLRVALAALLVGTTLGTQAATDTVQFNVTITITSTCDIHTGPTTNMSFNSVASTATNVTSSSTLTVNCTNQTPYTIALDNGLHGGAGPVRAMQGGTGGTYTVAYQLYQDSAHSQIWGSTTGTGANVYAGTGSGAAQALNVYGLVPSANSSPGSYNDTITATVSY